MVLNLIFGITMSLLSKYLQFARRIIIIIKLLKKDPLAKLLSLLMTSYRNIERLYPVNIQLYRMFGEQRMV